MGKWTYAFGGGGAEGDPKRKDLLGGKGAGLAEMTLLGLPVPPGFTVSTEACVAYLAQSSLPADLLSEVHAGVERIGALTGMGFGDAAAPLLVSVRSGARASMPGMMDTILNLGLNDRTAEGLRARTQNARFVWDAYRRFVAMFGDVALGVGKEHFAHALEAVRLRAAERAKLPTHRYNAEELKRALPDSELGAEDLAELATTFKGIVRERTGKPFPEAPEEQLRMAIEAVFRSWHNPRAEVYRKMHGIPASWGTACTVQAMVFGNLGARSATGVAFTRNPSTGEKRIYGEWLPNAQGEDVVAGIRTPQPLAGTAPDCLEVAMPEAYRGLFGVAEKLESHFRDMQDLEFTVQEGVLYMLQCRTGKRTAQAAVRTAVAFVKEGLIDESEAILRVDPAALEQLLHPTLDPAADKRLLAKGLPASPGAATGRVVFTADDAEAAGARGQAVILVRVETSPEDIHGMKAARGILTARGGMTSHAAVVARGMGKPCVAGTSAIAVDIVAERMTITVYEEGGVAVGTEHVKKGDLITLDGASGSVYLGAVPTVAPAMAGELGELLQWADARRRLGVRANADTPLDATTARTFGAEGIGLCRTEHMFFDERRIQAVREMILSTTSRERGAALAKLLPVQREDFVGIFRAMAGLPVTIRLLDPPLHEFLPTDDKQIAVLSESLRVSVQHLRERIAELHEFNPMLGHRGCRLAVTFPDIYEMQVRAILEAARAVRDEGISVLPEIMIPLSITRAELERMETLVRKVAAEVFRDGGAVPYHFGTMIELPRAALRAGELARVAEFFSFGTNDLTQATMGLSRDDAGKFLPQYVDAGLLPSDPFVSLDQAGVGELVSMAVERGRAANVKLKLGICGEHGGDPASVDFFHRAGLDYVSCSPFRVIIARLAAAQAAVREAARKGAGATDTGAADGVSREA